MKFWTYFLTWLITFIVLTVLNFLFHGVWAYSFFYGELKNIIYATTGEVHSSFVALDYALIAAANLYFTINASQKNYVIQGMISGGILGLIAFGTWNLVNYAFIPRWPISIVVVDIPWHIVVGIISGGVLGITYRILKSKRN
jgi:uncharacterized membrane protein